MAENTSYSPQQTFARNILITAVTTRAIDAWARVHGYVWRDRAPEDVYAEGVDVNDGRSLWRVDLNDILAAIDKIAHNPDDCGLSTAATDLQVDLPRNLRVIRDAMANGIAADDVYESGEVTGRAVDVIFQVAAAGSVLY
jgi:hypothetical protein